jgi:hypothetical protein
MEDSSYTGCMILRGLTVSSCLIGWGSFRFTIFLYFFAEPTDPLNLSKNGIEFVGQSAAPPTSLCNYILKMANDWGFILAKKEIICQFIDLGLDLG